MKTPDWASLLQEERGRHLCMQWKHLVRGSSLSWRPGQPCLPIETQDYFSRVGSNRSAMTITPDLLADRFRDLWTARSLGASVTPALPHFDHCPNPCQAVNN